MSFAVTRGSVTSSVVSAVFTAVSVVSRIAVLGTALLTVAICPAQDALARLIPPDAPVIAGMQRSGKDSEYDRVWLATAKNLSDLKNFLLLTDADPLRRFDRVIVAASPMGDDLLGDHLLLAEGRFDWSAMLRSADAGMVDFHGVPVLVLHQAEHAGAETQWLAYLRNRIVLFGSSSAVQRALLRYQRDAPAEPAVQARLARIPRKDIAWSSVMLNPAILMSRLRFHARDRDFVPCLTTVRELVLGVQFGLNAQIDLRVVANTPQNARTSIACLNHLADGADRVVMRTHAATSTAVDATFLVASREDYNRWVDMFRHDTGELLLAATNPY